MVKIVRNSLELYEFTGNIKDTENLQYLFMYFPVIVDGKVLFKVSSGSTYTDLDTGDIYIFNAKENEWSKSGTGGGSGDCEGVLSKDIVVTGVTVGNYKERDILKKNTKMTKLFEDMVTKEQNPTYTAPSVSITSNITGLREVGETINPTISVTFKKNDAGEITLVELYKDNILIDSKNSPTSPCTFSDTEILSNKVVNYKVKITYKAGPIKETNLGNPYPTGQIQAGSKESNAVTITPVYASYVGIIDNEYVIANLTKIIKNTKNYTYKYSMANQRIVYLYPKSFGKLTTIKDENNFEILSGFTEIEININGIAYLEYRLTNTGSNSAGTLVMS